jgi:hypothetical protein
VDPPRLLKIWAHLRVFFVADSVHLFQIIGALERPGRNNSSCHHGPDAGYRLQFLLSRGVDVDLPERERQSTTDPRFFPEIPLRPRVKKL